VDQDIRHNLEILRSQSLSSLAEQHLEREIFSGRMPPGVRINEVNIAKSIGISRGPVREACRTLAKAGWLDGAL
jgi:DNA-binding GntR family transcriptional regulator